MDKYEYNLIIDQIRQAVRKRDVEAAVKIAEKIDWKKEKEVSALIIAADAYEIGRQYAKAKELLLLAYEKSQAGRQLAYRLTLLSAKTKEFDEAEEFYQDFVEMAPRDTARYVLQYRIAKAKGEPVEKLIEILEEYVDLDMEEKWMYELAKLYHIAGQKEKCVDLCDEMSLWFSHGEYVRKALDLKKRYKPLTKRQEENYNKADEDFMPNEAKAKIEKTQEAPVREEASEDDKKEKTVKQATIPFTILRPENLKKAVEDAEINETNDTKENVTDGMAAIPGEIDIEDIHVKTLEDDSLEAMDLQDEIAKNMQQMMEEEESKEQTEEEAESAQKQSAGQLSIEEVLRNLEERGILKADTVNKTVETLDSAAEAVDQAAEEAAIEAETKKENETIIEEIEIKDLAEEGEMIEVESALESFADDTVNGFVFTDGIDSDAIEKALDDTKTIPIPDMETADVVLEQTDVEENIVNVSEEKEPVGDATMEYEVVAEGKAADYEDYMENEESEQQDHKEIIKDTAEELPDSSEEVTLEAVESGIDVLEETTVELSKDIPVLDLSFDTPVKKIHPGIAPASDPVPANTASLKELFADLDEATKREIGILEEDDSQESVDLDESVEIADREELKEEAALENTEAESKDEQIQSNETEWKKTEADDAQEELTQVETDGSTELSEEADEEEIESQEEIHDQEESSKEESNAFKKADDVPQVNVTTNKNLNQTMSLNLEKIIITDEEMQPFESFKPVNGLEQKIRDTVVTLVTSYTASGDSQTGNIMILGDDKSGKTTMAIELIKLINKKRERSGRRIAKVDSSVLNTRGIRSSMKKLVGSDLIVENAQHLRKSVLNEFIDVGNYYTGDMLIVFEGETSGLKTMRNENEDIAAMFDHILVIKEYDVKEWVAYAKKYVATKNYMIDEMGTLALYKAIDDFYGKHQGIDQSDVENIVNSAIKKANKKVTRKITNLFSAKNDDTGMDILKEADFK